jgi:predicted NUDIX family phosphoesterase
MTNKMDEMIIVAPRLNVFENENLTFQGVNSDENLLNKVIKNISNSYSEMRRGDAEENKYFKQPIPYAVIKRGDEVFVYKRLVGGGETRLHNKWSLGVGGHMNVLDANSFIDVLSVNLQRELEEELNIQGETISLETVGLINDDENEVGEVHIGLLVVIELHNEAEVSVRETEQLQGEWLKVSKLKDEIIYSNLESWSQFVADILSK